MPKTTRKQFRHLRLITKARIQKSNSIHDYNEVVSSPGQSTSAKTTEQLQISPHYEIDVPVFSESEVASALTDQESIVHTEPIVISNIQTPKSANKKAENSPVYNPKSRSFRKKRLFNLRSPQVFRLQKITKTYGKANSVNISRGEPTHGNSEIQSNQNKNIHQQPLPKPTGRRLFTIDAIQDILQETEKHALLCGNPKLKIVKEIRSGLQTIIIARCDSCGKEIRFDNDKGAKSLPINEATVWAGNTTGAGYTAMRHCMVVLDVPFLAKSTYLKYENQFGQALQESFHTLLLHNGKVEKELAVSLGQIDSDGVAWTDVFGDGQWSQRCYNQQGKALSASAVVIGALSKLPLFVGVRNKVCYICKTNSEKEHVCFRNYEGSSSAMETSIIKEAFEQSVEMHELRYKRFVGDGDSSVFMSIKDVYLTDPSYFTSVQKITCKLHAIRAMNRNLINAEKNSNKNSGYPKQFRDFLSERIHLFGKYANYIIQRHIEMRPSTSAITLSKDLLAMPRHIFGLHDLCSSYICDNGCIIVPDMYKSKSLPNLRNPPSEFSSHPIWKEIVDICGRLSELSTSLLYNMNTNIAEQFQAQVNKFAQGRRCNNVMRGGYNRKVQEATFSFIYGPTWYVDFYLQSKLVGTPSSIWLNEQRFEMRKKDGRNSKPRKRKKVGNLGSNKVPEYFSRTRKPDGDRDYGPNSQSEDLDPEELDFKICKFLAEKEVNSVEEQWEIHLDTIGQHTNPIYKTHRFGLITASVIGELIGLKDSTPNVNMIDKILCPKDISQQPAVKWGLLNESKARKLYEVTQGVIVNESGLFIDLEFAALGASPDGLVGEDGIIEIKCPYNERYLLPEMVAERKKNCYLEKIPSNVSKQNFKLKKTSHYYLQVVQQLHLTGRSWCDFIIWTQGRMNLNSSGQEAIPSSPDGHLLITRIYKDSETAKKFDVIMEKATRFFYLDLGPEIVNSRFDRNMGYRQPDYRLESINLLKDKKKNKIKK